MNLMALLKQDKKKHKGSFLKQESRVNKIDTMHTVNLYDKKTQNNNRIRSTLRGRWF